MRITAFTLSYIDSRQPARGSYSEDYQTELDCLRRASDLLKAGLLTSPGTAREACNAIFLRIDRNDAQGPASARIFGKAAIHDYLTTHTCESCGCVVADRGMQYNEPAFTTLKPYDISTGRCADCDRPMVEALCDQANDAASWRVSLLYDLDRTNHRFLWIVSTAPLRDDTRHYEVAECVGGILAVARGTAGPDSVEQMLGQGLTHDETLLLLIRRSVNFQNGWMVRR